MGHETATRDDYLPEADALEQSTDFRFLYDYLVDQVTPGCLPGRQPGLAPVGTGEDRRGTPADSPTLQVFMRGPKVDRAGPPWAVNKEGV